MTKPCIYSVKSINCWITKYLTANNNTISYLHWVIVIWRDFNRNTSSLSFRWRGGIVRSAFTFSCFLSRNQMYIVRTSYFIPKYYIKLIYYGTINGLFSYFEYYRNCAKSLDDKVQLLNTFTVLSIWPCMAPVENHTCMMSLKPRGKIIKVS